MKHLEAKKKQNISSHKFSDEVYAQILDSVAVACADAILICEDEMLLAKRNIERGADRWAIIGGRMIAGESPAAAISRKLFQEAGLQITDLNRFEFSEVYSAYYPIRAQEPRENGSHTINFTFLLRISPAEKAKLNLTRDEYQDFRWVKINEMMDFLKKEKEDVYITNIIGDAIKKSLFERGG